MPARIPIGLAVLLTGAILACGPSTVLEFAIEDTSGGQDSGEESSDDGDAPPPPDLPAPGTYIRNALSPGGAPIELEIQGGVIVNLATSLPEPPASANQVDLGGAYILPPFIDSHIHLIPQYGEPQISNGQTELARAGVVGGVDMSVSLGALPQYTGYWIGAGPMIGLNEGQFGIPGLATPVTTPGDAMAAVDLAFAAGARVISVDINSDVNDAALAAVVARAHELGLPVAARQLSTTGIGRAAAAGADILSNTPLAPMSEGDIQYWSARAVVSTQSVWQAEFTAVENLRLLYEAGATILYGTDLGLQNVRGIDPLELAVLTLVGMTEQEILAAGTTNPAEVWGLDVGTLDMGRRATFMVVTQDPLVAPMTVLGPVAVWIDGVPI